MSVDPYLKKIIPYQYCGKELQFRVSQDMFSSFQIDIGTQFLIRMLAPECSQRYQKVLDLGCGYGPIGLTLKSLNPAGIYHLVDKDALAIEYSRQNAELNRLDRVSVYSSLDYDNVTDNDFDLIVSNIPAKAGQPVIKHILEEAFFHLVPGGKVAVVVVTSLEETVAGILGENPLIEIIEQKRRSGHQAFIYRFRKYHNGVLKSPIDIAGEADAYHRGPVTFNFERTQYHIETAYGLPEFDQLDMQSQLLLEGFEKIAAKSPQNILVFNPGVGHIPVIASKYLQPADILLVDRDLLSLAYSRKNLLHNGYPDKNITVSHCVWPVAGDGREVDLTVGILREDEGINAVDFYVKKIGELITDKGSVMLAGSSTAITRVINGLTPVLKVKSRIKQKGVSSLLLERAAGS